jgi:hypothetical protein
MRNGQEAAKPGHFVPSVLEVRELHKAKADKELEVEDPTEEEGKAAIKRAEIKNPKRPK